LISFIVVTYNSKREIVGFLTSLLDIVRKNGLDVETLITDNASEDGTQDYLLNNLHQFPELRVSLQLNKENLMLSRATDEMIELSKGDRVAICNADIRFPISFPELLSVLEDHPECGIIPEVVNEDGTIQRVIYRRYPSSIRVIFDFTPIGILFCRKIRRLSRRIPALKLLLWIRDDFCYSNHSFGALDYVEQPGGPVVLFKRETLLKLTPYYDVSFPVFWGDVDMALRARSAGIKFMIVSRVKLTHNYGHSTTLKKDTSQEHREFLYTLLYGSNGMMGFARKWGLSVATLRLALFLGAVLVTGIRFFRPRARKETNQSLRIFRCSLQ
jgi:GT2 family glycosyltransferase